MEVISAPRIIVAGVGSAVGKSVLTMGLATALRQKGHSVSCCMIRPALLQASILRRISGRFVNCLDSRILSPAQIMSSTFRASLGANLLLIEGQGGLYDGYNAGSLHGSDAEIARITESPVLIVADLSKLGSSLAAVLRGYTNFVDGVNVVAAIGNRCVERSRRDEVSRDQAFYNLALRSYGMAPLLGAIPELKTTVSPPPNFAFQGGSFISLPRQLFVELASAINASVDLDRLLELAHQAPRVGLNEVEGKLGSARRTRIAVSEDSCFGVCFQDNLDLLRFYGADVVSFSPLADQQLPDGIGAVYLTGAAIAEYGPELAHNFSMIESLRKFSAQGGVIYSEGAGTAYLSREYVIGSNTSPLPGVGILPISCQWSPSELLYQDFVTLDETVFGQSAIVVKGLSTDQWRVYDDERLIKVLKVSTPGKATILDGFSPTSQSICTFSFLHFGSNPLIARNLVAAAEVVQSLDRR